jgi:hypothetical protein
MADLVEFRLAIEAARQKAVPIDGITFTLKLPGSGEFRRAYESNRAPNGEIMYLTATRQLLELALVGWSGLTQRYLLPSVGDETPVVFSPEAKLLLLDLRTDTADQLAVALKEFREAFEKQYESAAKN